MGKQIKHPYVVAYGNLDMQTIDIYPDAYATQREALWTVRFWLQTSWDRDDIVWAEVRNLDKPNAKPKRMWKHQV